MSVLNLERSNILERLNISINIDSFPTDISNTNRTSLILYLAIVPWRLLRPESFSST